MYDVIIIGTGPAGLTGAIYAQRAQLKTLVIERKPLSGGQILNTYEVDNYPGLQGISGFELGGKFHEHAKGMGAEIVITQVLSVEEGSECKRVVTDKGVFEGKTIILATGTEYRMLKVPGEDEFTGMGVSYCAICDGAFFKNRAVAVIGGGDVAVEDAIYLSRGCQKVYLIHRRGELRASKSLQNKLFACENVEILWNTVVEQLKGEGQLQEIQVKNVESNEMKRLLLDGVFIAVGIIPNTEMLQKFVELDEQGFIEAGEDCRTSRSGVYAIGDVRKKALRQIITAAADGANAITSIEKDLM